MFYANFIKIKIIKIINKNTSLVLVARFFVFVYNVI